MKQGGSNKLLVGVVVVLQFAPPFMFSRVAVALPAMGSAWMGRPLGPQTGLAFIATLLALSIWSPAERSSVDASSREP
jgi:hypothetical protein